MFDPGHGLTPLDRRQLLIRGLALAAGILPGASLLATCGDDDGMMGGSMPDWMMSGEGMMGPEDGGHAGHPPPPREP